uniref:Uncharacterized protein n=1 Tax=Bionectria ochroleuca TaxID=29856 RepID=A0A0B7JHB7_BIOOC
MKPVDLVYTPTVRYYSVPAIQTSTPKPHAHTYDEGLRVVREIMQELWWTMTCLQLSICASFMRGCKLVSGIMYARRELP